MGDEVICSQCGQAYQSIGIHWSKSSSCDYPDLGPEQREIVAGLLLGGATLYDPTSPDHNPILSLNSTRRWFLDWVDEQFPALGRGITQAASAEEAAIGLWERRGQPDHLDPEDIEANAIYTWEMRSLPALRAVHDTWYDADRETLTPPSGLIETPLILTTLYGRHGKLRPNNNSPDEYLAALPLLRLRGDDAFWRSYLQRWSPRVIQSGDAMMVCLQDSVAFFEYLAADPLSGAGPIPGGEAYWPDDDSERSIHALSDEAAPCPTCGVAYERLGTHWKTGDCPYPDPTERQRAILDGLFLAGGTVQPSTDTSHSWAAFGSADRDVLEWLQEELGVLAATIHDREGGTVDRIADKQIEFGDSYHLTTRSHPVFDAARRRWYPDGEKQVPDDLSPTPALLRTVYALRGYLNHRTRDRYYPRLYTKHINAGIEHVESLLAEWEPVLLDEGETGVQSISIREEAAFFEYIGSPPCDSVRNAWPP